MYLFKLFTSVPFGGSLDKEAVLQKSLLRPYLFITAVYTLNTGSKTFCYIRHILLNTLLLTDLFRSTLKGPRQAST